MMTRPKLLDLFCCAGGASMGYHRAGFDVVGVDFDRTHGKRYPFDFYTDDAIEFAKRHGHEFDAIAASPPCQAYSRSRHTHDVEHPDLVEPTREALIATGKPYVIENVEGAPLIDPIRLCGTEFDLTTIDRDGEPIELRRHRLFESNVFLMGAGGCQHRPITGHRIGGAYGGGSTSLAAARIRRGGYTPHRDVKARLLGIDWRMTEHELNQSIPPAYTEHLGRQLIEQL